MTRAQQIPLALAAAAIAAGACGAPSFEKPRAERPIELPGDHANHPGFKTEWWYWNGHLTDADGSDLDFFLSFTRHDTRGDRWFGLPLLLSPTQSHLAIFSLTERDSGAVHTATKVNQPDFWAADAEARRPWVHHDSWAAQWHDETFYVTARANGRELHLTMTPDKPAALYGQRGFVDTGSVPHYVYSYTRMRARGALIADGKSTPVSGIAWFDHFIGHPRSTQHKAWDWLAVQLDDGTDLMLAQLRDDDGHTFPYANFSVDEEGRVSALARSEVVWRMRRMWQSERSGDVYRLYWTIEGPDFALEVEPVLEDQEVYEAPVKKFWEGPVHIRGVRRGRSVSGQGYLETVAEGGLPVSGLRFADM